MLDIKWMRENREALADGMRRLNDTEAPWEQSLALDERRRQILSRVEALRAERNTGSKQVGVLMREKKKEAADALSTHLKGIGSAIEALDAELREVVDRLERGESPEAIEQSLGQSSQDLDDGGVGASAAGDAF